MQVRSKKLATSETHLLYMYNMPNKLNRKIPNRKITKEEVLTRVLNKCKYLKEI